MPLVITAQITYISARFAMSNFVTNKARPRRSVLYMPASNAKALEKAKTLRADCFIFDLEDAVAPDVKVDARRGAVAAAASNAYGQREIIIRVNGLDTMWVRDDVQAAATSGAHGVAIPKVQSADDVQRVAAMLQGSGAPESLALWAMIESPQAVLAVADIARASPMLAGLIVGTNDLAKDLHCTHPPDRWTMMVALQQCVLGARAAGIVVLDGVHLDLEDEPGLATACRQSRDMGFDGKTLIHPKQIDAANAAFAPSATELDRARRIVAAYEDATSKGRGVTLVDGRLIEGLHVLEAQRLLAQADAINALQ